MPAQTNYVSLSPNTSGAVFAPGQQPGPYASGYVFPNQGQGDLARTPASTGGGADLGTLGAVTMITGGVMSAIGAYYAAESQKMQLKSQASAAEFAARIADQNARQAEADAQFAIRAGQREAALYSLRAGQAKASLEVSQTARGLQKGEGTAAEMMASQELAKQMDLAAIDTNTLRQSQALRRQAVNERQQALMGYASARNLRASAKSIRSNLAADTQLLGITGQAMSILGQYQSMNRRNY